MRLYHTGYEEIRQPDVHHGRKNADFGQGFYMTDDEAFACRWARERKGEVPIVNVYELQTAGLRIHTFDRGEEWFSYIRANRRLQPDALPEADVIIGPIANDTLYDTLGIITSGFLRPDEAVQLLMIGPAYRQIVLKTVRAAQQLQWLSARALSAEEISHYKAITAEEAADYQAQFATILDSV